MSFYGCCVCGVCRYTLDVASLPVAYACYCLDCQTMSGSGFTLQSIIPVSLLSMTGETIDWTRENARGNIVTHRFCASCKTRLFSTNEERPGVAILRMGTLQDSSDVVPAVHMWVKRRQPWIGLPPDAETYPESVPAARMKILFAPNFESTSPS